MTPRSRLLLLLFLVFSARLFSQYENRLGKAPFFATFNARKLAAALTDGLPNDSLKARSIYLWTVHHIRYDVRAYSKGRMSYLAPKKILFHRKAYCIGYSILFDSLCDYAGVNAEMVIGYDYDPWYEARDTFFVNGHAWNAVQIDGQWKLLDATWASGYIKMRKQTFRKMLYFLFRIPFRQKYRFVRQQNDFYYETPPELFVRDHLPGTPAWQLLPCSVPIDSFQRSPTAVMHFLRDSLKNCTITGNDSIGKILAEPEMRHQLEMGKQAVFFNKYNHLNISYGYSLYADELVKEADDESQQRTFRILLYDSAAKQYDSAALYFKKTYNDYKKQEHFFLGRNNRMRDEVMTHNKAMYRKYHQYGNAIRAEWAFVRARSKVLKRQNRALKKASRKFQEKRLRTHRPDKPASNEAIVTRQLLDRIDSNNRMIAQMADSLKRLDFRKTIPLIAQYDTAIVMRQNLLYKQLRGQNGAIWVRYFLLLNNYDTVMIRMQDSLRSLERTTDSLYQLYPQVREWPANANNKAYAATVKRMDQLIADNAKCCRKLAKLTETSFSEDSVFTAERERFRSWNDSVITQNDSLIRSYRDYASLLRTVKRLHKKSARRYRLEMHGEDFRFVTTNRLFRYHYGGYAITMRRNANTCKKQKAQARRISNKLKAEERKEARKAAAN